MLDALNNHLNEEEIKRESDALKEGLNNVLDGFWGRDQSKKTPLIFVSWRWRRKKTVRCEPPRLSPPSAPDLHRTHWYV